MKKRKVIGGIVGGIIVLGIIGSIANSGNDTTKTTSEPVKTQQTQPTSTTPRQNTQQPAAPTPSDVKDFNAAVSQTVNGLNINIAEVKIEKDKVSIGVNIQNPTQQKLTFYPDQGSIVIGDMQLDSNMFMGTGDVSGDVNAGVKRDGVIVFTVPEGKQLDIASVKEIKLNFGDVYNDSTYKSQEADITVPVK